MAYTQTASNEVDIDDDEQIEETSPQLYKKGNKKRLLFGISIAVVAVLLIGALIAIIIHYRSPLQSTEVTKTQDLVHVIMDEPTECLLDSDCTSYSFNDTELWRTKQVFNAFDGDDDDKWHKEEFIQFYTESMEADPWKLMDLNGDNVWSYKEAVIYMIQMSELSIVRDTVYPLMKSAVFEIYNYSSADYTDQLFWEYAAELTFVEFDEFQQGFVTKENYLRRQASLEFDVFAHQDPNHETITFDEFMDSRYSQQAMDEFVNTDLDALSAEYKHFGSVYNASNAEELLSGLELQHCLYSVFDFEQIRRRLAASKWDCIWAVVGCTGATTALAAGCVAAGWTPLGMVGCAGGAASTSAGCYGAYRVCQSYLDANGGWS